MAGTLFRLDMAPINNGLIKLSEKMIVAVLMYSATKASEMEGHMRRKAPWTDRTGMARQTLTARVSQPKKSVIRITCSHGVDYGIWLELAHSKNYAIVAPTINEYSPKIVQGLQNILQTKV